MSGFDSQTFRRILGHYPTGVCVITAMQECDVPVGMAVGSFTSVSLEPPLVGFFPDRKSTSWPKIERTGRFCVNVLADDQLWLCRKFASKEENKFEGTRYRLSASGMPILEGVIAWIDCTIDAVYEAGDHSVVLGRVETLEEERSCAPLIFCRGGYGSFAPLAQLC